MQGVHNRTKVTCGIQSIFARIHGLFNHTVTGGQKINGIVSFSPCEAD